MKKLAILAVVVGLALSGASAQAKKDTPTKKAAGAGDAAKGEGVFKEKNCSVCHFADKTDKRIGPGLKGLFKREKMWDDKPMNEANVRKMIREGGGKMTGFEEDAISAKELDNLIAYLKSL